MRGINCTRNGLGEFVLDIYEDPFEDAAVVKGRIVQVIEEHGLQLKIVTPAAEQTMPQ